MEKLDLKKLLKPLYQAGPTPAMLDVPAMNFLMIDGEGDPNQSASYVNALQALYTTAYTLKFKIKKELNIDYPVMALEGLWWVENMVDFSTTRKNDWQWTMMISTPNIVTAELVTAAIEAASRKKQIEALSKLRFDSYAEGLSAQILHIGPYATEAPTIQKLHDFIQSQGYQRKGKHHEIYLSDPNRTAPDKMKTIIRQPVG